MRLASRESSGNLEEPMAFVEWTEKYSVGVKEIDAQHKRLFDLINEFYELVKSGQVKAGTAKVVSGLLEYTIFHFGFEEKLMQKVSYPALESQKAAHKAFKDTVADYKSRSDSGKLLLSIEVGNYLKSWLTDHILKSDMLYMPAMKAGGVT
jgi:hemerythrin-like metal-binding protein